MSEKEISISVTPARVGEVSSTSHVRISPGLLRPKCQIPLLHCLNRRACDGPWLRVRVIVIVPERSSLKPSVTVAAPVPPGPGSVSGPAFQAPVCPGPVFPAFHVLSFHPHSHHAALRPVLTGHWTRAGFINCSALAIHYTPSQPVQPPQFKLRIRAYL